MVIIYLIGGFIMFKKNYTGFNRAEFFSPHPHSPRRTAFTLAEVLITLGIIGVVAALTLPTLMQNYQKQVAINRLKVNYNVMSNAVRMAEAEYGDITTWEDVSNSINLDYDPQTDKTEARTKAGSIVKKYILPYLNSAEFTETKTLAQMGYKRPIILRNGSTFASLTSVVPMLRLNNETVILVSVIQSSADAEGKRLLMGMTFYMDIDGPNGQNQLGKDVFTAVMPYVTNTKFMLLQGYGIKDAETNPKLNLSSDRTSILDECKTYGNYCGALIQMDGWQIKDDYPW